MSFKNEVVEKFVELMEATRVDAEERRRGSAWRAALLAIANIYPEDRAAIYERFASFKAEAKEKVGGGFQGQVIRKGGSGERVVATLVEVSGKKPCATCPDAEVNVRSKKEGGKGVKVVKATGATGATERSFESISEVLEVFGGSVPAMTAYCQAEGINGVAAGATKEDVARLIFESRGVKKGGKK